MQWVHGTYSMTICLYHVVSPFGFLNESLSVTVITIPDTITDASVDVTKQFKILLLTVEALSERAANAEYPSKNVTHIFSSTNLFIEIKVE